MDRKTMNNLETPMRYRSRLRTNSGITLIELLIAVAIVAILAAIAIPSYSSYVLRSHRTEAKTALLDIASLEERYFSTNNTYTQTPSDLGYSGAAGVAFSVGSGYYTVLVSKTDATAPTTALPGGTPATYTMTATAIGSQLSDGSCTAFTLNSTGAQGASPGTVATCWK
jgi:type IV pilus assembly protein PilE